MMRVIDASIKGLQTTFLLGLLLLVLPGNMPAPEPVLVGGSVGSGMVQVFVSGAVRRPGVYRLPVGTRLIQAINRSGGLLPGTPVDQLALTRVLVDGEQIHVAPKLSPTPVPVVAAGWSADPVEARPRRRRGRRAVAVAVSGPVLLNQATIAQLDGLPGIGRKRAGEIIAFRQKHGPFRRVEDLQRIPGIGPKLLHRMRPYLRL